MENQKEKLRELLEECHNFMLVTKSASGELSSRPMRVAALEKDFTIYFFSPVEGKKSNDIRAEEYALLTYQDGNRFVSVAGHASISFDKQKIEEFWREPYRVWFTEGINDPKISLICFKINDAEYWDNAGLNKIKYGIEAVRAYASGETPVISKDQHDHVTV